MTIIGEMFAAALTSTMAFAIAAPDRITAISAWAMLATGWMITVIIAPYGDQYLYLWPAMDAIFGTLAVIIAYRTRQSWLMVLAILFLGQCATHITWRALDVFGPIDPRRLGRYEIIINVLFALQLLTVAGPGAQRVLVDFVHYLRRFARLGNRGQLAR